jgi:hypothetical protein
MVASVMIKFFRFYISNFVVLLLQQFFWSCMQMQSAKASADSWILVNHDYSWEEVVLNGMDALFPDDENILAQLKASPSSRAFDAARLSDVCRDFRNSCERMDSHLQV